MLHLFNTGFEVFRSETILGEFNRPQKRLVSKGKYRGKLDRKQTSVVVGEPQFISNGSYVLYTSPEIDIRTNDIIKINHESYRASRPFRYREHMEINLTYNEEV